MLGDKILFKPEHHQQADKVIDKIDPNIKNHVVLIGGSSGVGKTETAILVQRYLYKCRYPSLILSLDDYYKTFWKDRDSIRKKTGIDSVGASEIQWGGLISAINNFRKGEDINYKRINKYSGCVEEIKTRSNFRTLIIEGLYALHLKNIADVAHHIEGDPESTYEFRKERGKENPDDSWRQQIINKEYSEVMRLKENDGAYTTAKGINKKEFEEAGCRDKDFDKWVRYSGHCCFLLLLYDKIFHKEPKNMFGGKI